MFSDPEKNIAQLSLGEGNYVADFGSGSGFYSFAAAEAVGSTGRWPSQQLSAVRSADKQPKMLPAPLSFRTRSQTWSLR